MLPRKSNPVSLLVAVLVGLSHVSYRCCCYGLSLSSSSSFHGRSLQVPETGGASRRQSPSTSLFMRKQKASDRRTRRLQRGGEEDDTAQVLLTKSLEKTITSSPMDEAPWNYKSRGNQFLQQQQQQQPGGRGRSRKRSTLYNSLSSYHQKYLMLLTFEYQAEEQEVLGRLKASVNDPLSLEEAGHALYDLYPERRGNIFADEVYRLVKAKDATVSYCNTAEDDGRRYLPPNHKFSNNDVILLTWQKEGSGDFFDPTMLPTGGIATSIEARVISTGPTYVDIALPGGAFEAAFGPAPNNIGPTGRGDKGLRLRADRFFSNVPYTRMVAALSQLTAIPNRKPAPSLESLKKDLMADSSSLSSSNPNDNICMDDVLKEAIIATHAFTDPNSPLFHDPAACDLQDLGRKLARPPMPSSVKLANQALTYIQNNPHNVFQPMNGHQLAAIGAALTRKLTLIQGPPGCGKTTVASAIAFGFTHQTRTISKNAKVLACAFSNVGADNLVDGFLPLGLKVVRVGKASGVSEHLWNYTLDAAIDRDPDAQKALQNAARATAQLAKLQARRKSEKNGNSGIISQRMAQEMATFAVKQSIKACQIAATKALREADVVVSTSTGASDPRLLAACGLAVVDDEMLREDGRLVEPGKKRWGVKGAITSDSLDKPSRVDAPDGLPPISLPFVIVDEACQSVEPATLIPLTASNSCRALVLLGDPCQLPATVKSDPNSELAVSLMERLAGTLPQPTTNMPVDSTEKDTTYLDALPIKQARSLLRSLQSEERVPAVYRKRFAGSLLLGIQYRMHPSISAFSSAMFYDGLLTTPALLGSRRTFPRVLRDAMPCGDRELGVRMIHVGGRCNEKRGEQNPLSGYRRTGAAASLLESTTYYNEAEAERVFSVIKRIVSGKDKHDPFAPKTIGVVTPYSGQVQLIKSMIASDVELQALTGFSATIEVKSVDGYQGRERDVIIFSAVRSNRQGKVGFLSDWRRLNVAMTRARNALIVVGDLDSLAAGDKHWAAFGKWCQGVRCIMDDTEDPDECASV